VNKNPKGFINDSKKNVQIVNKLKNKGYSETLVLASPENVIGSLVTEHKSPLVIVKRSFKGQDHAK